MQVDAWEIISPKQISFQASVYITSANILLVKVSAWLGQGQESWQVALTTVGIRVHKELSQIKVRGFLEGPTVKTPCFQCRGCWFDPWSGNQDPTCCPRWQKKKKCQGEMMLCPHTEWATSYQGQNYGCTHQGKLTLVIQGL